ncbi:MFS family permease [Mesorhizobium soli]|uniref:MFS transporter n=1 Tax=Pseudaminobacter soli (ex Li et al. 2025) TaxID=1295366 RepID=UPI002474B697|nr:MFS transporter [Mesorhizobium soli]MDH6229684.1 MFS family permease [Mesorhizobium soli]
MSSIRPLIPLLVAAGFLLGGNGLQGTLIALRGAQEGFSPSTIGFMGTTYFAGFLLGCMAISHIMKAVGHVRSFSALAAIASAGTLLLVLVIDPVMWSTMRFITGFCFAGLFTVMESWLNSGVQNHDRARVLALYRIIDIGSVTGAQFMIPIFGASGFAIFAMMSIMITLSLVPVSLGDRSNPKAPEDVKLDLGRVWRISPLGSIGCIAVGVTNSAFRTLSPVYAQQIGMSVADVVTFVCVGIIGGAIIQYPLGSLSDRWDRRKVLLLTTTFAMLAAVVITTMAGKTALANFGLVFIFGSFAMPLYSLSAAHANDRADKHEFVLVNAALMLFYSIGAIAGPFAASTVMQFWGPHALFGFMAAIYSIFIVIIIYRMGVRSAVPANRRGRFIALLRTSTVFARLARRKGDTVRRPQAAALDESVSD